MHSIIFKVSLVLILLAMIPPVLIARARYHRSDVPPIHIIQDMDNQPRFRAQHSFEMFADDRAMRPEVPGTVKRGPDGPRLDAHLYYGLDEEGAWATTFPREVPLSMPTLERGRERFNIYCTPCHGQSGDGEGIVSIRAMTLMQSGDATWVQAAVLYDPTIIEQPVGQLFNTVTNGKATMPAYASQIPVRDRWAIIAYVRALQRSQNADWDDVPESEVPRLRELEAIQQTEYEQQLTEGGSSS